MNSIAISSTFPQTNGWATAKHDSDASEAWGVLNIGVLALIEDF